MLSPGCRPGDKESDLLITALINSDGDEAAEVGGSGEAWFRLPRGIFFPFVPSPGKDNMSGWAKARRYFLWISPACLFSSHPELAFLEKAAQSFQWEIY